MNSHCIISVLDTFEHIMYGIDFVNPTKEDQKKIDKELKRLPEDICVWSPNYIEHEGSCFEEIQTGIPYYSNHVCVNTIDELLELVL